MLGVCQLALANLSNVRPVVNSGKVITWLLSQTAFCLPLCLWSNQTANQMYIIQSDQSKEKNIWAMVPPPTVKSQLVEGAETLQPSKRGPGACTQGGLLLTAACLRIRYAPPATMAFCSKILFFHVLFVLNQSYHSSVIYKPIMFVMWVGVQS